MGIDCYGFLVFVLLGRHLEKVEAILCIDNYLINVTRNKSFRHVF